MFYYIPGNVSFYKLMENIIIIGFILAIKEKAAQQG